ncbi:MAG: KpsF/GutQ family sugar-phosphate isomerase [Kiritimatiellia bacterium]|jgi:arabinose-5-phosphate isomerase
MKILERARAVLQIEIKELQRVSDNLDEGFSRAVELILQRLAAGGKIVVAGVGKSFLVGQKIAATLASTGSPSLAIHPAQAMHGDIGILNQRDVLLGLSFSGESGELLDMLPVVHRQGAGIVAMTGMPESTLARLSDVVITMRVSREACPFNMAPTASTTAMLAVGDALAIILLEERGFKREDFAKLHPGGAIGRSLLLRVADIMRTGDRLAAVPVQAMLKDAILAMTRARSGAVGVLDDAGFAVGIFTDGDLRRLIGEAADLPARRICEVMTAHPLTVRGDDLAVTALKLYEEHNIDDLLVVDAEGRLIGLVDIQDLPKFKIF